MNLMTGLADYFRSSRAEFHKVSWPSRQDTIRYTALVIGLSVVVATFFTVLDFGLEHILQAILAHRVSQTTTAPVQNPTPSPIDLQTNQIQATTPSGQPAEVKVTPLNSATPAPTTNQKIGNHPAAKPTK